MVVRKEFRWLWFTISIEQRELATWEQTNTYFNCLLAPNRYQFSGRKKTQKLERGVSKINLVPLNVQRKLKHTKVSNSRNIELNNNNTLSNETINYNKTPIYLTKTWGWWQINISQIISKVINMSYWQQKTIFINFDFKLCHHR